MKALELKIPPLLLALAFGAGMWAVSAALPGSRWSWPGQSALALVVGVAGGVLVVLGVGAFRRAGTTVDPRVPERTATLVCRGVYRLSRNPMYLGFLLCLLAWGVQLGHGLALLLVPAFLVYMNRFQIGPEERQLQARFGPTYTDYAGKVRRWL